MTALLKLDHCGFSRGRASPPVLRDVSLSIESGDRTVISGASGCGKTTLALLLAGLLEPSEGRRTAMPALQHRRAPIRMIFQDPYSSMNPRWRVGEWLDEVSPRLQDRAQIRDLCARLELPPGLLDNYPLELSGGECQRFNLIGALLANPLLLILDEATSMLDKQSSTVMASLVELKRFSSGMAVVLIEHDPAVPSDHLQIRTEGFRSPVPRD